MLRFDINLVFTIINLLILYFFLRKFLFGRVNSVVEKRKNLIEDQFAAAAKKEEEAENMKKEYEQSVQASKEKAAQIIEDAKIRAQEEYDHIIRNANADAAKVLSKAEEAIAMERVTAFKSAKAELVDMVMSATEKAIGKHSTPEQNKLFYDEFLAEVGDNDHDADSN